MPHPVVAVGAGHACAAAVAAADMYAPVAALHRMLDCLDCTAQEHSMS